MAVSVYADVSHGERVIAQMNITPLVDVLLVLLVIFMVTAPLTTDTLSLRLPQAGPSSAATPAHLTLQVRGVDEFELAGQRLTASQLGAGLLAVARTAPETVLEIDTAGEADYQGFATALGAARASGLDNIAFPR